MKRKGYQVRIGPSAPRPLGKCLYSTEVRSGLLIRGAVAYGVVIAAVLHFSHYTAVHFSSLNMSSITPALPKGTLILITGANGYIASHIVNQLLKLGYRVRGTVRNEKPWLNKLFSKYGEGTFETVIVPEITIDGAFDEAVKGVDGIMHVVRT